MTNKEKLTFYGITLTDWNSYIGKGLSEFKVPKSVKRQFTDASGNLKSAEAFDFIAYIAFNAVLATPDNWIVKQVPEEV